MKRRNLVQNGLIGMFYVSLFPPQKTLASISESTCGDLILQRYPGLRNNINQSIYEVLSEEDIRKMPQGMNSIAWNIWHMARAEDVGINRLVTDGQQIFDQGNYQQKLNIDVRHFGTGMSTEEVQSLSETIDLTVLREYHEEVGKRSLKVFGQLDQIDLNIKLDPSYLHKVMIGEGVLHENALFVEDFYRLKLKSWFLVHLGLTHNFEHLGQIMIIRKLLGHKGTR